MLIANTDGIALIREQGQFDAVESVFELDESYKVFSDSARQFKVVPDLQKLCR